MAKLIDSSVAAKWFLAEPGSERAASIAGTNEQLWAPDLIFAEIANLFWRACRQGRATNEAALSALGALAGFFDAVIPHRSEAAAALAIALDLDHPAYDCFYLAIAAARDVPLLTADMRLARKVAGTAHARHVELL